MKHLVFVSLVFLMGCGSDEFIGEKRESELTVGPVREAYSPQLMLTEPSSIQELEKAERFQTAMASRGTFKIESLAACDVDVATRRKRHADRRHCSCDGSSQCLLASTHGH